MACFPQVWHVDLCFQKLPSCAPWVHVSAQWATGNLRGSGQWGEHLPASPLQTSPSYTVRRTRRTTERTPRTRSSTGEPGRGADCRAGAAESRDTPCQRAGGEARAQGVRTQCGDLGPDTGGLWSRRGAALSPGGSPHVQEARIRAGPYGALGWAWEPTGQEHSGPASQGSRHPLPEGMYAWAQSSGVSLTPFPPGQAQLH